MSLVRFALVLAALSLCALGARAQARTDCPPPAPTIVPDLPRLAASARDRGLLWRLDKDGRTSWLYGTVHLNSTERMIPGPTVRQALRDVEVVALEIDPADPEIARLMQGPGDPARELRVLAGGLAERLDALWAAACLSRDASLGRLGPLLRVTTVGLQQMRHEGFHPELSVDIVLWSAARQMGKPLVALETPAQQLAIFAVADEAEEREMVARSVDDLLNGEARNVLRRLLNAWAEGDLAALADYASWCRCVDTPAERAWMKRLNDDRNIGLADRLASLHGGTTFFAGVGALHMTGPAALPRLLAARGFQVQRVPFAPEKP